MTTLLVVMQCIVVRSRVLPGLGLVILIAVPNLVSVHRGILRMAEVTETILAAAVGGLPDIISVDAIRRTTILDTLTIV
jgi:uncharacterized membrane protein